MDKKDLRNELRYGTMKPAFDMLDEVFNVLVTEKDTRTLYGCDAGCGCELKALDEAIEENQKMYVKLLRVRNYAAEVLEGGK